MFFTNFLEGMPPDPLKGSCFALIHAHFKTSTSLILTLLCKHLDPPLPDDYISIIMISSNLQSKVNIFMYSVKFAITVAKLVQLM